jgi:hypothetical protein
MEIAFTAVARRGLLALFCAVALAACGGGDGASPAPAPPSAPPAPPPSVAAPTAALAVTVVDNLGRFVDGANVSSATASASSDTSGRATVLVATGSEQTIRIGKEGFAEQVKVVDIASGAAGASLQAMLIAREAPQVLASNEVGGSVSGKDGVKVTLPEGAFVTAGGQAVSGAVQMLLTPVDVTQLDIGAFPGLFEGIPTGGVRSPLVSVGTAELVPQQGGQKLALAPGKTAEIELPLYETKDPTGKELRVGDAVPLWSLDSSTGVWLQEGEGSVVLSALSPTGLAVRATISHFSWWNLDYVPERATVNVVVTVPGETVPDDTRVGIEGRVVAGTGPATVASTTGTIGRPQLIQVSANATTRLSASLDLGNRRCTGSTDVSPPPNAMTTATISLTCVDIPVPRIVVPAATVATNSQRDLLVRVVIDGPGADSVEIFANTTRIAQFGPQFFYTAFWDTSSFAEGTHRLTARATRDGATRTSAAVDVVVDRTPPRATSFTPAAGTDVTQETIFTVNFNEPVNSLPFALTDVVKLTVTPIGAATPVELPIAAALSTNGRTLTVQPQAAVPLGVVGLSWAGLKDAATNNITGTVAATYGVSRTPLLFVQAQATLDRPALAINSSGQVVAAWSGSRSAAADPFLLHVGVRGADGFTLFGAPADNPLAPGGSSPDLALDAADRAHVMYSPAPAELIVRRFNAGAWQTLGAPFANVTLLRGERLRIDPSGRPVMAFVRNNLPEVHVYDDATNIWTALGSTLGVIGARVSLSIDLALMPNADPVIVVGSRTPSVFGSPGYIQVARYSSGAWTQLGGLLSTFSQFETDFAKIEAGASGLWVLSLRAGESDQSFNRLLRFNGTDWEANAARVPSGFPRIVGPSALALLNDNPVVLIADNRSFMYASRFINGAFEPSFPVVVQPHDISLATRGNTAVVAYPTGPFNSQIVDRPFVVRQLLFP